MYVVNNRTMFANITARIAIFIALCGSQRILVLSICHRKIQINTVNIERKCKLNTWMIYSAISSGKGSVLVVNTYIKSPTYSSRRYV